MSPEIIKQAQDIAIRIGMAGGYTPCQNEPGLFAVALPSVRCPVPGQAAPYAVVQAHAATTRAGRNFEAEPVPERVSIEIAGKFDARHADAFVELVEKLKRPHK